MGKKSNIQWCDSTINFWSGCTKVSDGCKNCYAETLSNRRLGNIGGWGKGAERRRHESASKLALSLNRKPWVCDECGADYPHSIELGRGLEITHPPLACNCGSLKLHRRRIFSLSLGDWLDPEVPIEWLAEMLDTIRRCDQVDWLLCTKRPKLFFERMEAVYSRNETEGEFLEWLHRWIRNDSKSGRCFRPPQHVIVLASVENRDAVDERYGELLNIPAARRGFSVEPLLEDLNLHLQHGCRGCNHPGNIMPAMNENGRCSECDGTGQEPSGIDWVIVGGESGQGARPCNVEWIRSIKDQCKAAGVPCFVKQVGAFVVDRNDAGFDGDPGEWPMDTHTEDLDPQIYQGAPVHVRLRDKKGGDMAEWPEDLQVREFYK